MEQILISKKGKIKLINPYPKLLGIDEISNGLYELKFKQAV